MSLGAPTRTHNNRRGGTRFAVESVVFGAPPPLPSPSCYDARTHSQHTIWPPPPFARSIASSPVAPVSLTDIRIRTLSRTHATPIPPSNGWQRRHGSCTAAADTTGFFFLLSFFLSSLTRSATICFRASGSRTCRVIVDRITRSSARDEDDNAEKWRRGTSYNNARRIHRFFFFTTPSRMFSSSSSSSSTVHMCTTLYAYTQTLHTHGECTPLLLFQ